MVHTHISEDMGNRQRMGNIGIATLAHLAFVAFLGKFVGALYAADFFSFEIEREFI